MFLRLPEPALYQLCMAWLQKWQLQGQKKNLPSKNIDTQSTQDADNGPCTSVMMGLRGGLTVCFKKFKCLRFEGSPARMKPNAQLAYTYSQVCRDGIRAGLIQAYGNQESIVYQGSMVYSEQRIDIWFTDSILNNCYSLNFWD